MNNSNSAGPKVSRETTSDSAPLLSNLLFEHEPSSIVASKKVRDTSFDASKEMLSKGADNPSKLKMFCVKRSVKGRLDSHLRVLVAGIDLEVWTAEAIYFF